MIQKQMGSLQRHLEREEPSLKSPRTNPHHFQHNDTGRKQLGLDPKGSDQTATAGREKSQLTPKTPSLPPPHQRDVAKTSLGRTSGPSRTCSSRTARPADAAKGADGPARFFPFSTGLACEPADGGCGCILMKAEASCA